MAVVFQTRDAARHERAETGPSCGGWVESSFDLHRGMDVIEDVGFDEFERWRAIGPTPQARRSGGEMVTRRRTSDASRASGGAR